MNIYSKWDSDSDIYAYIKDGSLYIHTIKDAERDTPPIKIDGTNILRILSIEPKRLASYLGIRLRKSQVPNLIRIIKKYNETIKKKER